MAVPAGPTEKRHTGNGVTTIFTVPFLVLQASDLAVYINGIKLTSGYTQTGVGNPISTVTFTVAPALNAQILFALEVPFERLNDYQENGDFMATTVNRDYDRIWQALKQLLRYSDRSLRLGQFDVDGQGWYRAKGNGIRDLRDPVQPQDAATMKWTGQFVSDLIGAISGPINNALNIFFKYPDGSPHVVQDLSSPTGMNGIGALGGSVGDYLPARVHIRKFGVKADGVTDDSDALEQAILSGIPLQWGSGTIRTTRALGNQALIPGAIDWVSDGASIVLDSPTTTESVLYFSVLPLNHRIIGVLKINGGFKAFAGMYIRNNSTAFFPLGYGTYYSSDLQVENIRRADAVSFFNGDGILIRGGFTSVVMDRPVVKNVILAPGAGITSVVGVTGISIFGNTDGIGYPRTVVINHPYIENISSEDPLQNDDMDGIRIFGPAAVTGGTAAIDSTFLIRGGVFRDCFGRSIKSQMTTGEVIGSKFIRTTGPSSGIGNDEIAFQQGAGFVKDIVCLYYGGNVPGAVVNGGEGVVERKRPSLKVDGVFVANHSSPAIPQIVITFAPANDAGIISVSNIEVQGPVDRVVEYLVDGDGNALSISNITVDGLTTELVRAKTSGFNTPFAAKIYAENCFNLGAVKPLVTHRVPGNAVTTVLSESNCTGFTRNGSADTFLTNPGSVFRPYAIAGEDQMVGGSMRVQAVSIAAGAIAQIPGHGINGGVCIANLSINRNNTSAAVLSISAAGVVSLGAGSDVIVGTTTEPATGLFRVWAQASGGGAINIRNNDVSARVATLISFG